MSVARDMLGTVLVRVTNGRSITGIISETEAYGHTDDPASHAYRKLTPRNQIMFDKRVGLAYVYFTYGMHYCLNATARDPKKSGAGAVLIRAIRPQKGIPQMIKNRGRSDVKNLANGPAKVAQALGVTTKQYGEDLAEKTRLYITGNHSYDTVRRVGIISSARVGIKNGTDKMWNFSLAV